jgi:chromate transporter
VPPRDPRLSLIRLAGVFLRIGTMAFGGLGATLVLLERELGQRRAVLSKQEVAEALTYTKLLPGSTVVQVVAYLGWRLGGWWGSAVSTVCFLLPSALLMAALAYGYSHVAALPAVGSIRRGVLTAVVALLLLTLYRLARPVLTTLSAGALACGAFVAVAIGQISVGWVVIAAGIIGLVMDRRHVDAPR